MSPEGGRDVYLDYGPDNAERAAVLVRSRMEEHGMRPEDLKDAVVIGSGLGSFTKNVLKADRAGETSGPVVIPYSEIYTHLGIESTAADLARTEIKRKASEKGADDTGHAKRLVIGPSMGDGPLVFAQDGREHPYEDVHMRRTTFWLRVMQHLGIRTLIGTNAAGIVTPNLLRRRHDLMMVQMHVDETGQTPLWGPNFPEWGERFPHRGFAYPQEVRDIIRAAALELGLGDRLKEGIYFRRPGPQYESPVEVLSMRRRIREILEEDSSLAVGMRMFAGRDKRVPGVVGMSSTYEAIVAEHARQSSEMPAFVEGYGFISVPTNYSAAMGPSSFVSPDTHEEVKEAAKAVEDIVEELVVEVIQVFDGNRQASGIEK